MTGLRTPSSKLIDYVYDALNRLTAKRYPLNASLDASYTYDLGSRLKTADIVASGAAKNSFTYDAVNRLISNTQTFNPELVEGLTPIPYTLTYDYDKAVNRTKVTYPSGKVVDYTYDEQNRMDKVKVNAVAIANFDYDSLDRRTVKDYLPGVKQQTTYQFDIANQLKGLTNKFTAAGNISQFGYPNYDNVGNRLTQQLVQGGNPPQRTDYGYNAIYELETVSGVQTHTYDYDNVGNRELADGVTYVPNSLNQYDSVGGVSYAYDGNGNLSSDGRNAYTYDEENRLTTLVNAQHSAQYEYDAFNRRVSKRVDGLTTYFISDGAREIAEYNASGQLQAEYVHGDYIDEVLAMSRAGKNYYYHYDGLGSVSDLTDDQGNVVERYTYDVYGQPSRLSSVGNPFLFTGRRFDDESGLYYYRLRMYSPTIGRFLQRDPIGYYDSMNLFEYCFNNPTNWVDPWGLYTAQLINLLKKGGYKVVQILKSKAAAIIARRQGKNVIFESKQAAREAEKAVSCGIKKPIQHKGHDLPSGGKGMPHYQTSDIPGHSFWAGVGVFLIDFFDPFGAEALDDVINTQENSDEIQEDNNQ